jgi:hypothetical protein
MTRWMTWQVNSARQYVLAQTNVRWELVVAYPWEDPAAAAAAAAVRTAVESRVTSGAGAHTRPLFGSTEARSVG